MATAEPNVYPATIAGQIERLQQAKADLKTAIEGKGVTVSSSAKLDDYHALVDSIQAGGGGGGGGGTLTKFTFSGLNNTVFLDSMSLKKSGEPLKSLQESVDYMFDSENTISFLVNIEGVLTITLIDMNVYATYDIALTIG